LSAIVIGLIAAAGTWLATRRVAPFFAVPLAEALPLDADDALPTVLLALPQAASTAPIDVTDMPITLPRRRKSRRLSRPATNSSMVSFSSSLLRERT
jgi:hypothetical protein